MKRIFTAFLAVFLTSGLGWTAMANEDGAHGETIAQVEASQDEVSSEEEHHVEAGDSTAHAHGDSTHAAHGEDAHHGEEAHGEGHHAGPAAWAVIPFVTLLLMIATGPLFFEHFWHKNYPLVAVGLATLVIGYYLAILHDGDTVIHSFAEYMQFIALLSGLFMASGGIMIKVDKEGTPMTNIVLLVIGAVIANLIGTTGASMLLVRPFIRLNKDRIKPYHIIFFIFMVSNVGGALTPIGDPPLFLGFLKGVPFQWTVTHDFLPWVFAIAVLAIVFYIFDSKNKAGAESVEEYTGAVTMKGGKNFVWIAIVIAAVFIDPNVFDFVPAIELELHGHLTKISFLRESIMLSVACLSYYFADQEALRGNEFEFEPIKEVAFIFIGIFFTMMPALALVGAWAQGPGKEMISVNFLYWSTGALSGVLDNAPTYMNFFTAAISAEGGSVNNIGEVIEYTEGAGKFAALGESVIRLTAISVASVFFGAMTYIGNAPNFMVKSIAEQAGIEMPSFFGYITRYSLPILLPILLLVWVVFFVFGALPF